MYLYIIYFIYVVLFILYTYDIYIYIYVYIYTYTHTITEFENVYRKIFRFLLENNRTVQRGIMSEITPQFLGASSSNASLVIIFLLRSNADIMFQLNRFSLSCIQF